MADILEPRQKRSRDTHTKLLKAAVAVLNEHGLESATIPRIAEAAGVSSASVYRRFRDKDALLRTVFLGLIESSRQSTRTGLRRDAFADPSLAGIASELIRILIRQYREFAGVMRAMLRFAESDVELRKIALASTAENLGIAIDLLAEFSSEIPHSDPRRAVTFALLSVATSIEGRILEPISVWDELHAATDDEFHAELTEMFLTYVRRTPSKA